MQAATPKCPRPHWRYGPKGREEELCGRPLRWAHELGEWQCEEHGRAFTGGELAERNLALLEERLVFVGEE